MSDISQIRINSTTYSLKDGEARAAISALSGGTVTSAAPGLMSAGDKIKLDGIADNANAYVHPSYTSVALGLKKVKVDDTGHVSNVADVTLSDLTSIGVASSATVTSGVGGNAGLMSANDKQVLDALKTSYDNLVEDAPAAYDTLKEIGSYISTHGDEYAALSAIANTQSDWNQTVTSAVDYIKNKPSTMTNPNALKIKVGGTDKQSYDGSSVVGVNFIAGDNISIGESNGSYTFSAVDTTYGTVTSTTNGLMTAADKQKLDNIAANANTYTHPTYTAYNSGLYKITTNTLGHVTSAVAVAIGDLTSLGVATSAAVTTATNGLMTSADKTKLNNIAENANAYVHPTYTSKTSGLYKIEVDSTGHVSGTVAVTSADIANLGFTTGSATSSTAGIVKISDNYTSSAGNASSAVAASSQAVYNVYNILTNNGTAVTSTMSSADNSKKIATTAFVNNFWNGKYTFSTTDLTEGTSNLTTGNLYFVYEA